MKTGWCVNLGPVSSMYMVLYDAQCMMCRGSMNYLCYALMLVCMCETDGGCSMEEKTFVYD